MSYRVATCNAHAPSSAAHNRKTINLAAAACDVLKVQEADSQVVAAMRDLDGWTVFVPTGLGVRNPIAWRSSKFELVTSGWARIMRNKAGVKDGPDRSMVWVVLREKATGRVVVEVNVHLIHQAFTSHKERRPSWYASLAVVGAYTAVLVARHRAPAIISGDWNNPGRFNIPDVAEREVASPATFGARRYDRFFIVGKATATGVRKVATPSDHDTLVATITLGAQATEPKPAPKPDPTPREAPVGKLTDLATAARKSGLKVVELDGWRTRGRPGSFAPRGVLCHHTGGSADTLAYAQWMAREGRSDLPAPLCQLALDRKGTVYICAAGRANHGGKAKASGPMPSGDANALYIGIEAMNTGSEGWTRTQRDAYVRLVAALCEHYGWPASHVRAHRETSVTGKWDPGRLDMDDFRADVARAINSEDWFDMASKDDLRAVVREELDKRLDDIAQAVWLHKIGNQSDAPKGRFAASILSNLHNDLVRDLKENK